MVDWALKINYLSIYLSNLTTELLAGDAEQAGVVYPSLHPLRQAQPECAPPAGRRGIRGGPAALHRGGTDRHSAQGGIRRAVHLPALCGQVIRHFSVFWGQGNQALFNSLSTGNDEAPSSTLSTGNQALFSIFGTG